MILLQQVVFEYVLATVWGLGSDFAAASCFKDWLLLQFGV